MIFSCKYRTAGPDGEAYAFESKVEAESWRSLECVLKKRGLGEFEPGIVSSSPGYDSLSELLASEGSTIQTLHFACFIGFLAVKSKAVPVDWVLGDCGFVHEMIHHLVFPDSTSNCSLEKLVEMARKIEQAIPGHPTGPHCVKEAT